MPKFTAELADCEYYTAFRDVLIEGHPEDAANAMLRDGGEILMSVTLRNHGQTQGPHLAKAIGLPKSPGEPVKFRFLDLASP